MIILGIETSCDETAAAVVKNGTEILSNITASSAGIHARTGGIIPEDAARKQITTIIPVIDLVLKEAKLTHKDIDAIAIDIGHGLIGSLLVGVETAKTLARVWQKPIIPVNHLVAHIYANWMQSDTPTFPALCLIVSGGHTGLVLMKKHGTLEIIGETRDDAAGEAFDKTARLLGLPYPGGPSISAAAEKYLKPNVKNLKLNLFPRPLIHDKGFDWSFSGLKTAVSREVTNQPINELTVPKLAAEVQEAIVDVLIDKTMKAVNKYKPKSLLLSGGVAANKRLTEKFRSEIKARDIQIQLLIPEPKLCTDNGVVIATSAFYNYKEKPWESISANPELAITG